MIRQFSKWYFVKYKEKEGNLINTLVIVESETKASEIAKEYNNKDTKYYYFVEEKIIKNF